MKKLDIRSFLFAYTRFDFTKIVNLGGIRYQNKKARSQVVLNIILSDATILAVSPGKRMIYESLIGFGEIIALLGEEEAKKYANFLYKELKRKGSRTGEDLLVEANTVLIKIRNASPYTTIHQKIDKQFMRLAKKYGVMTFDVDTEAWEEFELVFQNLVKNADFRSTFTIEGNDNFKNTMNG